jgi:hypothetical protein
MASATTAGIRAFVAAAAGFRDVEVSTEDDTEVLGPPLGAKWWPRL